MTGRGRGRGQPREGSGLYGGGDRQHRGGSHSSGNNYRQPGGVHSLGEGYRNQRGDYSSSDNYRQQRSSGQVDREGRGFGNNRRPGSRGRGYSLQDDRSNGSCFKAAVASGKFETSNQASTPEEVSLVKTGSKLLSRPSYGTAGRPIQLFANYFKLKYKDVTIYHYDLDIKDVIEEKNSWQKAYIVDNVTRNLSKLGLEIEKKVVKSVCNKVFEEWLKNENFKDYHPVYDGMKNVFTVHQLPFAHGTSFDVSLNENNKIRKYRLTIKPVEKYNNSNTILLKSFLGNCDNVNEVIMALNNILNYRGVNSSQIQLGQSFFYLNQPNKIKLDDIDIWFGHHQSVQSTEKGPAVLINLSAKAFHSSGPVIDYINKLLRKDITQNRQGLRSYEKEIVEKAITGIKVKVTHLKYPKKHTVEGVTKLSATELQFKFDNKQKTVAQYFEIQYGRLKYPFLQCLYMKSNKNPIYIPFEHCVIEAQVKLGKLEPRTAGEMMRKTAIKPTDRFEAIEKSCKDVINECGDKMRAYNMHLDCQLMSVTGRVLSKPKIGYTGNTFVDPDYRGVWDMNKNTFYKSSIDMESWIIIDFAGNSDIKTFTKYFLAAGSKVGLNFGQLIDVKSYGKNVSSEQALQEAKSSNAAFAVIFLSRRDKFRNYEEIKFIANYKLNLVNQCIDQDRLRKFNDQIATNICLKINAKLGGVNHILKNRPNILTESTMIMGADAVHFARGSVCPSIAAVVGSVDENAFKYEMTCRVQDNPDDNKISQELILDIQKMTERLLKFYHEKNSKYPKKLIFYRDGVSEGQFQIVHDNEIPLVQIASRSVIGHIIPITYIVVQKRHQARFKPQNPKEGVGKPGNIPPGTAIDTGVVYPDRFDFFLNSHEGIQGTNKSARYIVIHDDSKFTPDELQQLSHHLCYTYNKCNRSVSIPAPVKYADLACYRAKQYADFHLEKLKMESKRSNLKCRKLPECAREAIDKMGECGNSFFFL